MIRSGPGLKPLLLIQAHPIAEGSLIASGDSQVLNRSRPSSLCRCLNFAIRLPGGGVRGRLHAVECQRGQACRDGGLDQAPAGSPCRHDAQTPLLRCFFDGLCAWRLHYSVSFFDRVG
jgi:hypothetical protein